MSKKFTTKVIHFRFLEDDPNHPISMRDYRQSNAEIAHANFALGFFNGSKMVGEGLKSPVTIALTPFELSPYGGYTVVLVTNHETGKTHLGVAKCNSGKFTVNEHNNVIRVGADRFNRREGVEIATAIAELVEVGEYNPLAFITDSADRRLMEYLRNSELLDDATIDEYDAWYTDVRQKRNARRLAKRQTK